MKKLCFNKVKEQFWDEEAWQYVMHKIRQQVEFPIRDQAWEEIWNQIDDQVINYIKG
jgi:hypothetical protein